MSFYNNNLNKNNYNNDFSKPNILVDSKPKLVDRKILKKIKKKKIGIATDREKNSYSYQFKNSCMTFLKDNYGIIIIFSLLLFLLYFRYQDVKERRERQNRSQEY